jgi:hypothetical protein
MHVSRRLQGIIGEVDQSQTLTKDVVVTNPPTTTLKPVNTPYTVNPYGTATRPTNPLHKDWASVVSACKVGHSCGPQPNSKEGRGAGGSGRLRV